MPLLQGTVTNEGTVFISQANNITQFNKFLTTQYPDLDTRHVNQQYAYVPLNESRTQGPYFDRLAFAYGDSTFTCFGLAFAAAFAHAGAPVYSMRYNVLDPVLLELGLGVEHTWEVGAVWGPGNAVNNAVPTLANSYTNINSNIVLVMQAYVTSFARVHEPNTFRVNSSPVWREYVDGERLVVQTNATGMEMVSAQQSQNCHFWARQDRELHH